MLMDWELSLTAIEEEMSLQDRPFTTTWYYRMRNREALAWGVVAVSQLPPNLIGLLALGNIPTATS